MSKRLVLVGACLLAEACQGSQSMSLRVFTPDGGDPWVGDDAATQARLRIEDHQTPDQTVTVAGDGSFSLQVVLANPDATVRVVVEALRGGQVVGWGGTPLAQWGSFGPVLLPVFVQRRDTLAGAPWSPGAARTSPMLFELAAPYVTALGGAVQAAAPDVFDDLAMRRVDGAAVLDDTFNRDASAIKLTDGTILLVRGCAALIWSPGSNTITMPTDRMPPSDRCNIIGSTVVQEPNGGGLVVGGRTGAMASARVDHVLGDGTWATAQPLTVPRDHPSAVRLGENDALVAGGQGATADFLERYGLALMPAQRALHTGNDRADHRTRAAVVFAGDGVALALGGLDAAGATATEDLLLDTRCATGGCPVLLGTRTLLRQRRRDAVAALAEGARVVAASGTLDDGTAASAVEIIDVTNARDPQAGVTIASLPFTGLSMLPLTTGAVWIAGGGQTTTWFYRH